jgi:hypothetical protein
MNLSEMTQDDIDRIESQLAEKVKNEEELKPLIEKLAGREDIYSAIMSDKLSADTVKAIVEGKVSTEQAKEIVESAGGEATKEEIAALREMIREEVKEGLEKSPVPAVSEEIEGMRLAQEIRDFSESVDDFEEFREPIADWYDKNSKFEGMPLEEVYKLVKFERISRQAVEEAEKAASEEAKNLAARGGNGSGGGAAGTSEGFASAMLEMAKGMR